MSNILSIGKSALNAAQIGISTVGHNIANASTEGYSRQIVIQSAAQAQNLGYGYVGQGTNVTNIQRVYNETLAKQVTTATSTSGASSTYYSNISAVNKLISDSTSGISSALTTFYSAVNASASNPSDTASRQTLISSAQSLVSSFTSTNNQLNEMRDSINTQITASVGTINSYASQISVLNDTISKALSTTGSPPNDLMDQRDALVNKMAETIGTTVVKQDDGSYNIFVGSGMPLVVGTQTYALSVKNSDTDVNRLEVAYGNSSNAKILGNDSLTGGSLGGLLQFRSETLDTVQNQIGQLATTIATQFNNQLTQGYDLSGNAGTNLFSLGSPTTISSSSNTDPSKQASATITDVSQLTSSDYTLKYTNGQYTVTRLNDKSVMWQGTTLPVTVDGIEINVNSSTPAEGDSYTIKPTQNAASGLSLAYTDVSKIAMAGSATSGSGDNENGLKLAALQSAANVRVSNGTTNRTYAQAFSQMASAVGAKANELSITSTADATALDDATSAMQSESGVNLDEEAADLLRYQQAYQAAGKMMQIASQLFQTILDIG
jgi:flagellar hook-associated protein 1